MLANQIFDFYLFLLKVELFYKQELNVFFKREQIDNGRDGGKKIKKIN